MFGGFHTELAALKALGSWIEDNGWTRVLVQAGVTTPGTADSFLKASHISRTRHANQVTALLCISLWIRHTRPIGRVLMKEKSTSHSATDVSTQNKKVLNFNTGCLRFTSSSPF